MSCSTNGCNLGVTQHACSWTEVPDQRVPPGSDLLARAVRGNEVGRRPLRNLRLEQKLFVNHRPFTDDSPGWTVEDRLGLRHAFLCRPILCHWRLVGSFLYH